MKQINYSVKDLLSGVRSYNDKEDKDYFIVFNYKTNRVTVSTLKSTEADIIGISFDSSTIKYSNLDNGSFEYVEKLLTKLEVPFTVNNIQPVRCTTDFSELCASINKRDGYKLVIEPSVPFYKPELTVFICKDGIGKFVGNYCPDTGNITTITKIETDYNTYKTIMEELEITPSVYYED